MSLDGWELVGCGGSGGGLWLSWGLVGVVGGCWGMGVGWGWCGLGGDRVGLCGAV